MVLISIIFFIYSLYNCNCKKNKSYEKFQLNNDNDNNNPTFLNVINKNMNNIQNISNFNKKLLKNITDSNFNFNLNLNKNHIEKFIDINKITPEDIDTLNKTIQDILAGKDVDGNYDIDNINIQLNNIKTQLDNFLNQQQTEHKIIINSIDNTINTLGNTSNTLLLQKANISALQGDQTLFNDITIITANPYISVNTIQPLLTDTTIITPTPSPTLFQPLLTDSTITTSTLSPNLLQPLLTDTTIATPTLSPTLLQPLLTDSTITTSIDVPEPFENINQPYPYNNKLILTNLLPLNYKQYIEPHKIITKQNKNLFNNLPKSPKMNDFQRCQPNWQLEWAENLRQIKI